MAPGIPLFVVFPVVVEEEREEDEFSSLSAR